MDIDKIEFNKIFLLFLGGTYHPNPDPTLFATCKLKNGSQLKENELLYDSDWNWLMEVIDKIESMGVHTSIQKAVSGGQHWCYIERRGYMKSYYANRKIDAAYESCGRFLQWYKENVK